MHNILSVSSVRELSNTEQEFTFFFLSLKAPNGQYSDENVDCVHVYSNRPVRRDTSILLPKVTNKLFRPTHVSAGHVL